MSENFVVDKILVEADSLLHLQSMEENSVGSIVTDPPYGIKFMGKKWDYEIPSVEFWKECLRVLKPGGHILVFCGTRTQHRMAVNLEDAGFEIRDVVSWIHGQGFPKSYNIAKGIQGMETIGSANWTDWKEMDGEEYDSKLGYVKLQHEQEYRGDYSKAKSKDVYLTTENAKKWEGWGTILKPACEFITLARKPISEKSIPANVLKWGVGGLNIKECRIKAEGEELSVNVLESWSGFGEKEKPKYVKTSNGGGRFPANVILDEDAGELLNVQAGKSVSRFFYCPKPNKKEKELGLEEMEFENTHKKNPHPTVKPVDLMKYLVALVTPLGESCLDPFMGTGTTGIACKLLGVSFIGIDNDPVSVLLAEKRIESW